MKVIGPKSVASTLYVVVKILFFLAVARALLMLAAPLMPYSFLQYVSFDVRSGPLLVSIDLFRGTEARWWVWASELVSRVYHAAVLFLLMRILEPVGSGEPFHLKTPNRLRMIGWTVIIGSALRTLFCVAMLGKFGLRPEPGVWVTWAIDFDAIFMGLVLVVLAEAFRRGYLLKTENELTV